MTFGIYLVVSFTQVPTWIDHEAGAVPVHRAFIFTLVNARGFQQFVIRIRQQVDCETKLGAETLMERTELPGAGVTLALFKDPNGNITGLTEG